MKNLPILKKKDSRSEHINEIWKNIPRFIVKVAHDKQHPKYQVSNLGNVRRVLLHPGTGPTTQALKIFSDAGRPVVRIRHGFGSTFEPVSLLQEEAGFKITTF